MLVSGGRLAAALIALITIRAVTTFLTPEQCGELALLIAVQMFCGLFLVNPIGQHINLHTHAWWDDGTLMARLKSYRQYVLVVSLVGLVVVLGMGKQHTVQQVLWTAAAMFVMVVAGTWNATLIPMLNMLGFRAASVLWGIVTVVIGLASSVLFVLWLSSATAWFAGQAIGMAVGALGAKYVLRHHAVRSKHSLVRLHVLNKRTIMTYCLPLAVATGFMWLQLSGYRFVIENYWGLAQLGFLAIGLQLAGQVWSLAESLSMQFLYPLFYRRVSAHENQTEVELAFSDLLNTLVPVYFVLIGLLILSAPYLLKVLVASKFHEAITFVVLGAGIEFCRVLGNLLSNAAHVNRKTKSLALPYAAGAIVSLALIYFAGIWQMGIIWAGAALIMGAMAMLVAMWISMRRQVRFTVDMGRWIWGAAVMLAMTALVIWMPNVSGMGAAIAMLVLVATPASVAVLALLWKNPAMLRLLNVQLQKH
jgi:O-antigen/teichoic acid export membrane protein